MKRVKSLSNKRLIAEAQVNGKPAYFLFDSGASVALIDKDQCKKYDVLEGRKFGSTVVGAGGEMKNVRYCNTFVDFEGKKIPQFLIGDISSVVKSIKRETGVEILGIISLPQMKICGFGIDANDMEIIVE